MTTASDGRGACQEAPHPLKQRRQFLAVAGASAIAAPAVVKAQAPIVLRFQSAWPTRDIFHEFALDFAKKVNELASGRMRVEMLPSGAVVKPFDVLDAVHRGQVDGGHAVCAYWSNKNSALSLFGTAPALGFDSNLFLAWMEHGGGRQLYTELLRKTLKLNVEGILYGPMGPQALGWFRKPIRDADDLRGMRFRAVGLVADLLREMGAQPVRLAGQEIVQALERGYVDAAEFNNPSSDRALGFADAAKVCYMQSFHQPAEVFEVLINKRRYDALPAALRAVFRYAAQAASAEMAWKAADRFSADYHEMRSRMGVRFLKTPESVLTAQLEAWRRVVQTKSQENPDFARIFQSQQAFARRAAGYQVEAAAPLAMAYDFWFGKRQGG